jgi:hypothetical protein
MGFFLGFEAKSAAVARVLVPECIPVVHGVCPVLLGS